MFNTIGKIYMISRAKRNFKFISGDSQKYYAQVIDGEERASALTRAAGEKIPVIAAMRKTEFLTDFLKSSYCDDEADRMSIKLIIASLVAGLVAGIAGGFINPFGSEFATFASRKSALLGNLCGYCHHIDSNAVLAFVRCEQTSFPCLKKAQRMQCGTAGI